MGSMAHRYRTGFLIAALVLLVGCAASYTNHGYAPTEEELSVLQVGRDTQDSVAEAIGRPSSTGLLKQSGWYYMSSRVKHYLYHADEIVERQLVAISFDKRGRVSNIERFTLEDGRVLALNRRVTDTGIKGVSFLRQLLSNIGRVDLGSNAPRS
jgi:outer membrane protein assembly factor BamE (lipoprotein component of BamABCDE complex)